MIDFVTFIIPTIGRTTLARAVDSVRKQEYDRWKCIVAGDGVLPMVEALRHPKIKALQAQHYRHESPVRNEAIKLATTDWVAFLDDDDTLSPKYVSWLDWERQKGADVVIFRQTIPLELRSGDAIIPSNPEIVWGNVGISYAVKTELAKKHPFKQSRHEDLLQLVALEAAGARIHFSSHIAYFGRDHRG